MAIDPDAKRITINYTGGSIRMAVGNVKDLFGEEKYIFNPDGVEKIVSVKDHKRTRVIGGPSTNVEGGSYQYTQWPVGTSSNSAGGEAILMSWEGSDGWWTARMHGSAWHLGTFLKAASTKVVSFKTENGTPYGPFSNAIL